MQLRRSFALTAAALALTAPALTSCGFDYATDRYYTPANGANNRDGAVDVLGAVVVSTEPGSGTFIASLSNNSTTEPATFTELGATEGGDVTAAEWASVQWQRAHCVKNVRQLRDLLGKVFVLAEAGLCAPNRVEHGGMVATAVEAADLGQREVGELSRQVDRHLTSAQRGRGAGR